MFTLGILKGTKHFLSLQISNSLIPFYYSRDKTYICHTCYLSIADLSHLVCCLYGSLLIVHCATQSKYLIDHITNLI